jgi:hypothetical protein
MTRPLENSYRRDLQALNRMRERIDSDTRICNKEVKDALIAGIDFVFTVAYLAPNDMDLAKQALDKKFDALDALVSLLKRP